LMSWPTSFTASSATIMALIMPVIMPQKWP
jgi:hypothetical protein